MTVPVVSAGGGGSARTLQLRRGAADKLQAHRGEYVSKRQPSGVYNYAKHVRQRDLLAATCLAWPVVGVG